MSKTLPVWSAIYYLTQVDGVTWRQNDYTANKIIHAVKGDEIKGYFEVKTGGKQARFTQSNIDKFIPLLCQGMARRLKEVVDGNFTIVPIPNSTATVKDKSEFATLAHARAIASHFGSRAKVSPALRWKTAKKPAHKGGSRDPQVHFDNLVLVEKPTGPIVLYDDVMTTGSQMVGSCRRLAVHGINPICGFVVGRATTEQRSAIFDWHKEEIALEESPIDLTALFQSTRK